MIRSIAAVGMATVFALSLAACSKNSNVSTQSAGSSAQTAAGTGATLVKAGTVFNGRLQQEISSKSSHTGDIFVLAETDSMFHKDPTLHGSVIDGHLENVTPAGMGRKPGMTVVFDDIKFPDGTKAPVNVTLLSMNEFNAKSHKMRTLGLMAGGAVAGHMAGHAAGKKHGGLLGAAGGYALSQEMKTDIDVKPGTLIRVKFNSDANAQQ